MDEDLGEETPEKDYVGNCLIYDPDNHEDPWHNVKDKVDIFIVAHLMGYWCKTLIFRDWWLTTVISIMFEFMEYSLEHQLANFSECWWDHVSLIYIHSLFLLIGTIHYSLAVRPEILVHEPCQK